MRILRAAVLAVAIASSPVAAQALTASEVLHGLADWVVRAEMRLADWCGRRWASLDATSWEVAEGEAGALQARVSAARCPKAERQGGAPPEPRPPRPLQVSV